MTRYLKLVRGKQGEAVSHIPLRAHDLPDVASADLVDLEVEQCSCARCLNAPVSNLPRPIVEIRQQTEGVSDNE